MPVNHSIGCWLPCWLQALAAARQTCKRLHVVGASDHCWAAVLLKEWGLTVSGHVSCKLIKGNTCAAGCLPSSSVGMAGLTARATSSSGSCWKLATHSLKAGVHGRDTSMGCIRCSSESLNVPTQVLLLLIQVATVSCFTTYVGYLQQHAAGQDDHTVCQAHAKTGGSPARVTSVVYATG
jgi:hypothetical protein